jgi:hypothetical protein
VAHELRWGSRTLPSSAEFPDFKIRFWLRQAALYSYLPGGLDPAQPDLARFEKDGP